MGKAMEQCCLLLSLALQDKVLLPGNPTYTASLASYFSAQASAIRPACIVAPETTQHVSTTVQILTRDSTNGNGDYHLTDPQGCPFAIRSGGHAYAAGASNMAGSVLIDLSGLSSITLPPQSAESPVVTVGVGSRWGSVYAKLDPLRLGVSGARSGSVGVGGLTIGGGISYFGPRWGWVCDTVTNLEVVLANGTVVNANRAENVDLLWALRGGTNNLGIVTHVGLQTFPQDRLWGGQVVSPFETAGAQMVALAAFSERRNYDEFASLITTFAYSGAQDIYVVVNNIVYTKPETEPPAFTEFIRIPSLSSTQRITNVSGLVAETDANNVHGLRQASATLTIYSSVAAINATVLAWRASVAAIRAVANVTWAVGFDPLPPQLYARHADANALGLTGRLSSNQSLIVVHLTMMWSDAADDPAIDTAARRLVTNIQNAVSELGALDPFLYVNYAASWQKAIDSYGPSSVDRLQQVRKAYDPTYAFTNLVPGGFKIPL